MTTMIKVGQIVGATERGTGFLSATIKWVVPIEAPALPLPPVFPLAEMTLMDGTKVKVTNTVDDVIGMINA